MSLISGSDDNKDDENHQIQSVGTKSISSNDVIKGFDVR